MSTDLLIAEEDAELRELYDRLPFVTGCQVQTAVDGLDCWNKLRARSPDVLLINLEIPWGGGDGVLARLREDGIELPAVFVTGDESPEVLSRRTGVPVGMCFQKPFRLSALLNLVGRAVAGRRSMARTL